MRKQVSLKSRVRKIARRDLCGGGWVTGHPTAMVAPCVAMHQVIGEIV